MLRWSLFVTAIVVLLPATASATNAGLPGFSGKTSISCGNCHGGTMAPTVAFSGPASLAPGAVGDYSVTITAATGANAVSAGIDIAADAAGATLTTDSAQLTVSSNEIVQKAMVPLTNNAVTFNFKVTAPAAAGTLKLFAGGMAGDGVDGASIADSSATATMSITIGDGSGGGAGNGTGGGTGKGDGSGGNNNNSASNNGTGGTAPNWTGCSMGGHGGAGLPLGLALLLLTLASRRRSRRDPR